MKIIIELIGKQLTDALGWFLIHSLWQGALIALVVVISMRLLKNRSAELRYISGCVALLILLIGSVITFKLAFHTYTQAGISPEIHLTNVVAPDPNTALPPSSAPDKAIGLNRFFNLTGISRHFGWVVSFWILGLVIFSLRTTGGLLHQINLSRSSRIPLAREWEDRFRNLVRQLGVRLPVRLFGSARVHTPIATGIFKPLILVPASLLTEMPAEQLEAILRHELAHIRRHDYLLNLIQTLIETIFFYHPGVWLISHYIRKERENVCDDIAVQHSGDKLNYVKALAEAQRNFLKAGQLAIGFSNHNHSLLDRIKRLNTKQIMKTKLTEKLAAIAVVITAFLLASFIIDGRSGTLKDSSGNSSSENDTIPGKRITIVKTIVDSTGREHTTKNVYYADDPALDSLIKLKPGPDETLGGKKQQIKVIVVDDVAGADELTEKYMIHPGDDEMTWNALKIHELEEYVHQVEAGNNLHKVYITKKITDPDDPNTEILVEVIANSDHPGHFEIMAPELDEESLKDIRIEMKRAEADMKAAQSDVIQAQKDIEDAQKELRYEYQYRISTGGEDEDIFIFHQKEASLEERETALKEELEVLEKELKAVQKELKKEKKSK
ncbi:MAG: M48 family metalloprotease [Bacteroidales bacterium]|nr:M48 family metalloprotease [Bacteroidales bacterium]